MDYAAQGIQLLIILFFLPAAIFKLIGHPHMRKEFARFHFPFWVARLAGTIELFACVMLMIGFSGSVWGLLGGLLLIGVMAGATWTNFAKRPPVFGWGTLVILLLCVGVSAWQLGSLDPACRTTVNHLTHCVTSAIGKGA